MTKEQKKPFTKREWITLIVLLSIVQAFFWYAVFENSQSTSALAYVSFAGTLVSIILAVLAIGYTYGESISQKGKSDGLAEQIKTLGSLIESVEIEAKSLEKIQVISKELTSFIGAYRNDKQVSDMHLENIQSTVAALTTVEHKPSMTPTSPLSELEKLFSDRSPLDTLCYFMLVYIEENQGELGLDGLGEIKELLQETPMGLDISFFQGAMYTQSSLLQNLGYIQFTDAPSFKIQDEFKDYIKANLLDDSLSRASSSYADIIKKVHKKIVK